MNTSPAHAEAALRMLTWLMAGQVEEKPVDRQWLVIYAKSMPEGHFYSSNFASDHELAIMFVRDVYSRPADAIRTINRLETKELPQFERALLELFDHAVRSRWIWERTATPPKGSIMLLHVVNQLYNHMQDTFGDPETSPGEVVEAIEKRWTVQAIAKTNLELLPIITRESPVVEFNDEDCGTCGEFEYQNETCGKSKRSCGHHCNCSWEQDECCWCGLVFDEQGQ